MCPSVNKDIFRDVPFSAAKLIVTARGLYSGKKARRALRRILPYARIRNAGYRSVYVIETHGNVLNIADRICHECLMDIGHTTAVVEESKTSIKDIKEAALSVANQVVGENESFSFRIKKRGSQLLEKDSRDIEEEIGGDIWESLNQKYGKKPKVDLEHPDVKIVAEVLGNITAIGIQLKYWKEFSVEQTPIHGS
ncbi:MAG TPA: THUMP domain-containing protein [Balneolales bacterium]|nr:THUMP domain-containing protein [Balneolales bacterium]